MLSHRSTATPCPTRNEPAGQGVQNSIKRRRYGSGVTYQAEGVELLLVSLAALGRVVCHEEYPASSFGCASHARAKEI